MGDKPLVGLAALLVVEAAQGVGDTVIGFLAAGRLEGSGLGAVGEGTQLLQDAELVGM